MTATPVLGNDLGTTNSVVAVADGAEVRVFADADGERLIPSVVSFHPSGDVIIGRAARDYAEKQGAALDLALRLLQPLAPA